MSTLLGIGCVIDKRDFCNKLKNNDFYQKYFNNSNPMFYRNPEYIDYEQITDFFAEHNLKFEIFAPCLEYGHDKNFYVNYKFEKKRFGNNSQSIDAEEFMKNYDTINEQFRQVLVFLFGETCVDDYRLTLFSVFTGS
jgi:hypothetical protein